jgi:hypothetical protein
MTTDVLTDVAIVGGQWSYVRAGTPYRAWSTDELRATLALNPVVKLAASIGKPVFIDARPMGSETPQALVRSTVAGARQAVIAAGETVGAGIAAASVTASVLSIGPIILAISGIVALIFFRKPILRFLSKGV